MPMPEYLTYEQVKWAAEKWCAGYTLPQIAHALLCSNRTLERAFKKYGFKKVRPVLEYNPEAVCPCCGRKYTD